MELAIKASLRARNPAKRESNPLVMSSFKQGIASSRSLFALSGAGLAMTVFLILIFSLTATAGGFQANLQGIKQLGMGYTGVGLSQDASSIFINPGALAFLKHRHNIVLGANLVLPKVTYQEPDPGFYTASTKDRIGTPFLVYGSFRFKDKWTVGLGVNTPFGNGLEYEDDWKGQFVIREIELKTFSIQPTVNYKISDKVGIGAGFAFYLGDILLRRGIPVADTGTLSYGEAKLTGSALGFGANIGVLYNINKKFSVGVDFRTPIKMKIDEGDAEFKVPPAISDSFPKTTFSSEILLPLAANIGFGYHVNDQWTVALDVNYTGWFSYDTLRFDYAFNSEQLEDTELPREYKGSFTFRAGAQYDVVKKLSLRAGAYFDMTPVQDGFVSPESPDANRFGLTAGLSFMPSEKVGIDASFIYVRSIERSDGSDEAGFYGSYNIVVVVPSIGVHIAFPGVPKGPPPNPKF